MRKQHLQCQDQKKEGCMVETGMGSDFGRDYKVPGQNMSMTAYSE